MLCSTSQDLKKQSTHYLYSRNHPAVETSTQTVCLNSQKSLRARHKSCFLRPDTGPCRSDILQWYFDVRKDRCYKFFWGGCQGNGNRFETREECAQFCHYNRTIKDFRQVPYYCSLSFEFGSCFGHYTRWAWDKYSKSCMPHSYSGCGGNQNNFQTRQECMKTCLHTRDMRDENDKYTRTTCITFHLDDIND